MNNQREVFEQGHIETDAIYWDGSEYKPSNEGKYAAAETANNLYGEFKRGAAWQAATEQGIGEPVGEIAISNGGNTAQLFYSSSTIKGLGLEDGAFVKVYTHPPKPTGGGVPDLIEKAYMQGQIDCGVDPSYSNAKAYALATQQPKETK